MPLWYKPKKMNEITFSVNLFLFRMNVKSNTFNKMLHTRQTQLFYLQFNTINPKFQRVPKSMWKTLYKQQL